MKYLFFFIALFSAATAHSQCSEFDNLLKKGDNYLRGAKPNYQEAINAYTAAILACTERASEAKQRIAKMVSDINKLKENAVMAEKKAKDALTQLQKANEDFVRRFLENARKDMADSRVDDAYDKIQAAGGLGVLKPEVCKAYLANADSCLLDPDSSKYEIAKTSVDAAAAIGVLEPLEIGNAYIRIAENSILNLQYDAALKSAQYAEALKVIDPDTIKNLYLEVAFWYTESGNIQRAAGILDTMTAGTGLAAARKLLQNMPADTSGAVGRLREVLQKIDTGQYERLQRRYYPVMVKIPGGKFVMGCDKAKDPDYQDDETPHEQEVRSFEMASTETTVWHFALFCTATGREFDRYLEWTNSGDNPVVNVSWYDALKYANWVSRQKGEEESIDDDVNGKYSMNLQTGYRLPTEAEWEYAAGGGAGTRTKYAGTNEVEQFEDVAWYDKNSGSRTRSVGTRKANPLGLYDMSGNVWEWCWDWYGDYLTDQKQDYKGPDNGTFRVFRGGSWSYDPRYCRVSLRLYGAAGFGDSVFGFRLARTL